MRAHNPALIVLFWLFTSSAALASDRLAAYVSSGDLSNGPILPTVWYLEDPDSTMTLENALSRFQQGEFQSEKASLNFGYQNSAFWFVFMIHVPTDSQRLRTRDIIIELNYPHLDHIEFYKLASDGSIMTHKVMGDTLPFSRRTLDNNLYTLPDKILTGITYQYWIKVKTTSSVQLHPSVWDKDQYIEARNDTQIAYGFYFGVLMIMAVYNLFIGFSTKDRSYFYYFGYITVFCLVQACLWGYAFQYLWPTMPAINKFALPTLMVTSLIFGSAFARSFLSTKEHSPLFHKLLSGIIILALGIVLINFVLTYELRIRLAIYFSFITVIILLLSGVAVARQGVHSARLFLWAWTTMLLGVVIYGLAALGVLPSNAITRHASQIGSAIEVILLSFALADRINRMKAEKRAVELQAKMALQRKNQELQDALQQLTKSNTLKDEFLATISHELRTPMNGIEGSLQIVKNAAQDKTSKQHIDAAFQSAHHMTQLVESLLEYSELQSGSWQLNEKSFCLENLLKECTESVQQEFVNHNIKFIVKRDIHIKHQLIGDPDRLNHLIFQLLDNALKFTQQGSVTMTVKASEANEGEDCDLVISIADTGIGIKPSHLQSIFDSFRQADGSFSRQYGGLGIGLSICKAIVDHMGGTISVESLPNQGSCFTLSVKLQKGALLEQPVSARQTFAQPPRILVVEDNPVNQMTLIAMLKKLGCHVDKASNGEEAVRACDGQSFDMILMDCQMPVMDGFDATRAIRQLDNPNRDIPIVAVTANAMSGDRDRCLAAGMNDYMKKPIKPDAIRGCLFHWLESKAA